MTIGGRQIIAVAMSGGVDSSVTAALLKQQGHEIFGLTMRLFQPRSTGAGSAAGDAARVARHLGIPHQVVDLEPQFQSLVVDEFSASYRQGQTPNPCVRCNRFVKFGLLLEKAQELGGEMLATGHYVRRTTDAHGLHHLRTARYLAKDQSYFLYTLSQQQLSRVLFPLGEFESKAEVRSLARALELPVAEKGESQEVCFVPGDDYVRFLEQSCGLEAAPGEIVHVGGQVIGRHKGIHRHTIGQRRGLGIAWSAPLYVVAIDPAQNRIVVGEERHLYAGGLSAEDTCWVVPPSADEVNLHCKIRYRHQPVQCRVSLGKNGNCEVRFAQPQKSVSPGQAVVFYAGDEVLGGARIVASLEEDA